MVTDDVVGVQSRHEIAAAGEADVISFRPMANAVRKVVGAPVPDIEAVAAERWEIAPADVRYIAPAKVAPGHLDRIRGAEFGSVADVLRAFRGDFEAIQPPTYGYRLEAVDLVDGVLYADGAQRTLRSRSQRALTYAAPAAAASGTLYETWIGNRYFGNWLSDDVLTYPLAARYGAPVTTTMTVGGHVPRYEQLLGMTPRRLEHVHFDELIVFDDQSHNADKRARADDFRARVIAGTGVATPAHPGVFLLRGRTGDVRELINERDIAERLAARHGFIVLDPSTASVEAIVAACAEARIVAGVEGSQLVHGMVLMPPGAGMLTLQPPDRVVAGMKRMPDRQGQLFGLVVGEGTAARFSVDPDDVEHVLDEMLG